MSDVDVKQVLESIQHSDAEKRVQAENELLDAARSLTNGSANDPKVIGRVLLGLCEKMIEVSTISRSMLAVIPRLQTKAECARVHINTKKGLNLPTNISIWGAVATFAGLVGKFAGWW